MIRWYLLPVVGAGSRFDPRHPKYVNELGVPWAMMDYGLMPVCIAWVDATTEQHATLAANSDVAQVPENLDAGIGAASTTVRDLLETYNIAGGWVQGSDTWRIVLRTAMGMFQFAQALHGIAGVMLIDASAGRTLNTRWNQLGAAMQQAITQAAAQLGVNLSSVTNNTQIRAIAKIFADAWGTRPFFVGGVEL